MGYEPGSENADLSNLELSDTNEFSAVLNGLLSQYGMSLDSETQSTASNMLPSDPSYAAEPPYRNQVEQTYPASQYASISRTGSNESPYSVPRIVSTGSSPYSMVPRGASNSPYSGSHGSPYAVSQEDGSPYSSRSSSTVGANSEYLNGGSRGMVQNDAFSFQPYMKVPNNGAYPCRPDHYSGSYPDMMYDPQYSYGVKSNDGSYVSYGRDTNRFSRSSSHDGSYMNHCQNDSYSMNTMYGNNYNSGANGAYPNVYCSRNAGFESANVGEVLNNPSECHGYQTPVESAFLKDCGGNEGTSNVDCVKDDCNVQQGDSQSDDEIEDDFNWDKLL